MCFKDCTDCAQMVVIPPGAFVMGSTVDEQMREGVPKAFADREGPPAHGPPSAAPSL